MEKHGNTSIYLQAIISKGWDNSAEFVFYEISKGETDGEKMSEKIRISGKKEKLSHSRAIINSPPEISLGSSLAVSDKHIFVVGGGKSNTDKIPFFDNSTIHNHVFCFDVTAPQLGWVQKKSLLTPRNGTLLVPSSMFNKEEQDELLYCFGHQLFQAYPADFKFSEDDPWLQIYDIKLDTWSYTKIQPTLKCKSLPYHNEWFAILDGDDENSTRMIVFCGLRLEDEDSKLFCLDLDNKQCDVYDDNFSGALHKLHFDNGCDSDSDPHIIARCKPAQDGKYLYFSGMYSIFCYDLLKKSWLPARMDGFDPNTSVTPFDPRPDPEDLKEYLDESIPWGPNLSIFNVGPHEFCLIWSGLKFLYCTKFVVDTGDDGTGTPRAARFSTTKKFSRSITRSFFDINCFAAYSSSFRNLGGKGNLAPQELQYKEAVQRKGKERRSIT